MSDRIGRRDHLALTHNTPQRSERFWAKVAQEGDCWVWQAATNNGYGAFGVGRAVVGAHRWAYLTLRGEIGPLVLDHLCRNRACVNPWHLEPVTDQVNAARGKWGALTTHCPAGHPYDETNTRLRSNRRGRECVTCQNETHLARKAANHAALLADPTIRPHGDLTTYNDWACRCRPCRDAQAMYQRARRQRTARAA